MRGHVLPELVFTPPVSCPQPATARARNASMETTDWRGHFFNWLSLLVLVALGFV
jgi:hypothetical protein